MPEREVKLAGSPGFRMPALNDLMDGVTAEHVEPRRLDTTYHDTPDLRLARWGCSLRYRAGEGWTVPPFAGLLSDGKIVGRGAGDMKAGLAAALFVVTLLREHAVDLRGRLTLAFASDEETGGRWGTEWLLANVDDVRSDACLIGESSGTWSIGIGEKGVLWMRIKASGVSGHAAYGQGESAISKVLRSLERMTAVAGKRARMSKEIAAVIYGWLEKSVAAAK